MVLGIPPGLFLILGALLVPLFPGRWRKPYMLFLPLAGLWYLIGAESGTFLTFSFLDYEIVPLRIDRLSLIFGYVFHIAAALSIVYAWHNDDIIEQIAGLAYAGSGIGAVFAGDLITLFIYWEAMAVTSVFLIWARRSNAAYAAGMRYLIIQVTSGVLLLSGAILMAHDTGSVAFDKMTLGSLATWLILIAFGIKCAFPLLHNWLSDAYPEATVTGTVFLSAFTTKCAVYVLARGFPGTDLLIYIGAAMALFPVFYAIIENDFRRLLAYALNQQLWFMVIGIGIGTTLAINGAVAHAFVSTLYKALLFMSMGAVLYRVGTVKGSELGGLYRSMPLTTVFCIIGAASISAAFGSRASGASPRAARAPRLACRCRSWTTSCSGSHACFVGGSEPCAPAASSSSTATAAPMAREGARSEPAAGPTRWPRSSPRSCPRSCRSSCRSQRRPVPRAG